MDLCLLRWPFFAVYADGGICLDILQNRWSPTYDVSAILTSIQVCFLTLQGNHKNTDCKCKLMGHFHISGTGLELQSRTKVLAHLSKTNAFYWHPSIISKKSFLSIAKPPWPPFQCWNTLSGHRHVVTTLKTGEGVQMWIVEIKKLPRSTKQVFFGQCLNCFCPWL